jgi:hypothetical protein
LTIVMLLFVGSALIGRWSDAAGWLFRIRQMATYSRN